MLPTPVNYAIFPGVIPADVPSEMTIVPAERAFLFPDGAEYTLTLIPVHEDEPDYYAPSVYQTQTASARDGVLRFTHTFAGEQEHLILLSQGEKKLQEFTVYSLREDLYSLLPLKGDLHAHSCRSDGKRDPAALAGHFREQGYDFFALTDHNRYYPSGEIDEVFAGVAMGLTCVIGEEVHTPDSVVHIVHVGGSTGVADRYVHDREGYEGEVAGYMDKVPAAIPAQYRERYAQAMWATDRIHEAGGLAIFPHPYWRPGKSRMVNVCDELSRILLTSGMFDAYELVGGMGQPGINCSVALWGDLRAEELRIPAVGSSDVHGIEKSATFPHSFTICFAEENENGAICGAVKAGMCVAVEATGDEYARHYRAYGSLRLVRYAQFLLQQYFPKMQRIAQGEGVAMRAYAMGEADAALIEGQAAQAVNFRLRFFGRKEPLLPSAAIRDFEARWREVQLAGPLTKGGRITAPPITRQI